MDINKALMPSPVPAVNKKNVSYICKAIHKIIKSSVTIAYVNIFGKTFSDLALTFKDEGIEVPFPYMTVFKSN